MKIIDNYILKEMKLPTIFGISLFTFIFLIEIVVSMMENIIVRGISLIDTLRMLSFYLPPILSQTIPMGLFLGVMVTFTGFTKNSEAIAMNSIGLSIKRILKPVFLVSIGAAIFIIFLQESIIPKSFEKLQQIGMRIALENPIMQLREQILIEEIDDFKIYIDRIHSSSGQGEGVLIFQKDEKLRFPTILVSKRIQGDGASLLIEDANFFKINDTGSVEVNGEFKEKKIPILSYTKGMRLRMREIEGMGVIELMRSLGELDKKEKILYLIEINRKLAVPLSTMLLSILGVLLSIGHHRSGKGTNYALSLGIVFGYIILLNTGIVMAQKERIPIFIGVWASNMVLGIITYIAYIKKSKVM